MSSAMGYGFQGQGQIHDGHITEFGFDGTDRLPEWHSERQVRKWHLEEGLRLYIENETGKFIEVYLAESRAGNSVRRWRTTADSLFSRELFKLPRLQVESVQEIRRYGT